MQQQQSESLRVNRIYIENIGGLEHLDIRPGSFTVVKGDNGQGKSSIIHALQAVFDKGNPVEIIRNGSDRGEVALELSNRAEFKKTLVRDGKATLKEKHPEYGNISAAHTHLQKLTDAYSVDPDKLISATPAERVQYFLKALPLSLSEEQLRDIVPDGTAIPEGHALTVLDALRKDLAERRRTKRSHLDEKEASIEELKRTLPAETADSVDERLAATRTELALAREEEYNSGEFIRQQSSERLNTLQEERRLFIESGRAELAAAIKRLEREWQVKEADCQEAHERATAEENKSRAASLQAVTEKVQPRIEELTKEEARLTTLRDEAIRTQQVRDIITNSERQASELRAKWEDLDSRIKRLDALGRSLTSALPIEGLAIVDNEIQYNGVAWPQLNTAKQYEIVLQVAILRAGEMPFIFMDGLERMSPRNFSIFRDIALRSGKQIMVTCVSDGPLAVETFEQPEHAQTNVQVNA